MSIRDDLKSIATHEIESSEKLNPWLKLLHSGAWITERFYINLNIQLIHRTRLNNQADSLALHIASDDQWLSSQIAAYLAAEIHHVDFAVSDLRALGVPLDAIEQFSASLENKSIVALLYMENARNKDILANVTWNWLQQWYSDTYDSQIIRGAQNFLGLGVCSGYKTHSNLHVNEISNLVTAETSYDDILFSQIDHLATDHAKTNRIIRHAQDFTRLYMQLLISLYQASSSQEK